MVKPAAVHRFGAALRTVRAFVREESGQDLLEYAFLGAFIATAGYVALNGIVPAIANTYSTWVSGTDALWDPPPPA